MKKKSQMEILGLAIVFVLLIISSVFVIRFVILKAPTNYRGGFVSAALETNMLNTLLKTTSDCSGLSMTELLQDCGETNSLQCKVEDSYKNSCEYVKDTVDVIFGKTLKKWQNQYKFTVFVQETKPLITLTNIPPSTQQCPGDKRSKVFPLPIRSGTMYVKLDICT
jgi:hypothetical protein